MKMSLQNQKHNWKLWHDLTSVDISQFLFVWHIFFHSEQLDKMKFYFHSCSLRLYCPKMCHQSTVNNFKVIFSLCFLLLLLHLCTYFLCHSLYQQETPFFLPYILLPIGSPLIFLLPFYLHRSCLCLHPFKLFPCSGLAITWPPLTHFSL